MGRVRNTKTPKEKFGFSLNRAILNERDFDHMKLSDNTRNILKNFSQINQSLLFKQGTVLRTVTEEKTLYGEATIAEEIPRDFAVHDLQQLLSALSMFNDPTIDVREDCLYISDGVMNLQYLYCDPETIVTPPDKKMNIPAQIAELTIDQNQYSQIKKAAATLNSEYYWFYIEDGGIRIGVGEDGRHVLEMKPTTGTVLDNVVSAKAAFSVAQLSYIPGPYTIKVFGSPKVIVTEWVHGQLPLRYICPASLKLSKFEGA